MCVPSVAYEIESNWIEPSAAFFLVWITLPFSSNSKVKAFASRVLPSKRFVKRNCACVAAGVKVLLNSVSDGRVFVALRT